MPSHRKPFTRATKREKKRVICLEIAAQTVGTIGKVMGKENLNASEEML